jgi:hypothetical protein
MFSHFQDTDYILCFRLAFFKAAYALFESDFYVKADDDILTSADTSRGVRIQCVLDTDTPGIHIWSHYLNLDTGVAGYVYPIRLG